MRQTPDKFPICAGARSAELVHNAGILGVQLINADEVFGTHRCVPDPCRAADARV
jgi:hypothetical protein